MTFACAISPHNANEGRIVFKADVDVGKMTPLKDIDVPNSQWMFPLGTDKSKSAPQ
jgi:hypothetical protein